MHSAKGALSEFHYSALNFACVLVYARIFVWWSEESVCALACVPCLRGIKVALEIEVTL